MTDENNKLSKLIRPNVSLTGVHAKLAQAKELNNNLDPKQATNRIGIVFDDSGSMAGDALAQAKKAVSAYLRSCNPTRDAVAVYPMTNKPKTLVNNWMLIDMFVNGIFELGSTPLYATLRQAVLNEPINHAIVFSDGIPDLSDRNHSEDVINLCKEKKIKVDTCYIGSGESPELKMLAEKTGGIYLNFDNPNVFAQNMKYLAPTYRAMLANPEVKARIEKGEKL